MVWTREGGREEGEGRRGKEREEPVTGGGRTERKGNTVPPGTLFVLMGLHLCFPKQSLFISDVA